MDITYVCYGFTQQDDMYMLIVKTANFRNDQV